jgi:NAD(P)-dependent dehydrogenase (short-subunit alcohol dehydrogenase family)
MTVEGKRIVITGAAQGIGLGIAERLAGEGARVCVADLNADGAEKAAAAIREAGGSAVAAAGDVASRADVRRMIDTCVEEFGGLDVMFNNAGISGARHPRLLDDDFADFHRVMDINLLGVMVGTREAARHMAEHGGGSIINISSVGGIQPAPGLWTYHTSKVSVIFFTKCAAVDLGEYSIRVNCIAPGNIETPILASVMAANMPEDEKEELMHAVREFLLSRQPLHRQGTTEDIAEAAVYFGSDRSSYVTGTLLPVDGGLVAGSPATAGGFEEMRKRAQAG